MSNIRMMIGNSSQWWVLIPPSQKPIAESLSSQYFASQSYSEWSCCVIGTGQYLWVMEDHSHDWTPSAFADSTEPHFSPSIPSMWPQESLILQPSSVQELRLLTSCAKQRRSWGFEEVCEHCCNPYHGREDTAGHSAPAQSSSFCNQLPECCAS